MEGLCFNVAVKTAKDHHAQSQFILVPASVSGTARSGPFSANYSASPIEVLSVNKVTGEVPLSEADIVVSGGRGLKGPEKLGTGN